MFGGTGLEDIFGNQYGTKLLMINILIILEILKDKGIITEKEISEYFSDKNKEKIQEILKETTKKGDINE